MIDLFSGIGGFSLASRWTGQITTVQFVEIDTYCRKALEKNFPDVPIHDDIRTFRARKYRGAVDLLCGGFPCQDISIAGKGKGLAGEKSGLWREMRRVINAARPRFCLIENVPAIRTRGIDRVLADLEKIGYSAEPFVVGAGDIGATHSRQRVWIVAIRAGENPQLGDASRAGAGEGEPLPFRGESGRADSPSQGMGFPPARGDFRGWEAVATLDSSFMPCVEREVRGVVDGIPDRVDGLTRSHRRARLFALGNSVVPHVAYLFLRVVLRLMGGQNGK